MIKYSEPLIVASAKDEKVKKMLDKGWIIDKIIHSSNWWYITFKKEVRG